jgi:predicted ATPase
MIGELQIRGFKKFMEQSLAMRPLTILAGMNGSGKTSVLHALLLIREATLRGDKIVQLNGPHGLELGNFEAVQNWNWPESIEFQLVEDDGTSYRWVFGGSQTDLYVRVEAHPSSPPRSFESGGRLFQYLSAERFGPRNISGATGLPPASLEVGSRGEYCAQVLYTLGSDPIEESRRCPEQTDVVAALLKFEAERWLSLIARPIQIDTELLATTTATALRFSVPGTEWVRPPNMGFGVSYALPVVLAGLTARTGGLLIVENPEAHLHPAGQSHMGRFLATIAAAGVQVLVETHSDHLLNGIRRAIGETRVIGPAQALVHFFDVDDSPPQALEFTESGGITSWPTGFFDQYQIDVAALTRVRRPR